MMWQGITRLAFLLLDILSAPLIMFQVLFRAISAIIRPVFMCCSRLGSLRSVASAAGEGAKVAGDGASFLTTLWKRVFPSFQFIWNLFSRVVLNGITKVVMWVLQHWTSFHRFVIVRHFRLIAVIGAVLSILIAWSLWLDD